MNFLPRSTRSSIATATSAVATLALSLLLLQGCNHAPGTQSSNAVAPGLREPDAQWMARHTADPNAPFLIKASPPHLAVRPSLLDVNNVPACDPQQLNLFESRAQANGLQHTLRLTIENLGQACRIGGYPTVSLLDQQNAVLGMIQIRRISVETMAATLVQPSQAISSPETPSPQVLLQDKDSATFQLGWKSGPACKQASRIAISAPGTNVVAGQAVMISRPLSVCEDQVLITAVRPAGLD